MKFILKEEVVNPFKRETFFYAKYHEVEKLLCSYYGFKEYDLVAEQELHNDTIFRCFVDKKLDEWEKKDIDEALKTKQPKQYRTQTYLKGLLGSVLEPGIYLIEISW